MLLCCCLRRNVDWLLVINTSSLSPVKNKRHRLPATSDNNLPWFVAAECIALVSRSIHSTRWSQILAENCLPHLHGHPMMEKFWRYVYSFWQNSRTWQTDGQTPHDGIGRTCAALCGKNKVKTDQRKFKLSVPIATVGALRKSCGSQSKHTWLYSELSDSVLSYRQEWLCERGIPGRRHRARRQRMRCCRASLRVCHTVDSRWLGPLCCWTGQQRWPCLPLLLSTPAHQRYSHSSNTTTAAIMQNQQWGNQIKFISGDKAHSTQTQMTIKHTHTHTETCKKKVKYTSVLYQPSSTFPYPIWILISDYDNLRLIASLSWRPCRKFLKFAGENVKNCHCVRSRSEMEFLTKFAVGFLGIHKVSKGNTSVVQQYTEHSFGSIGRVQLKIGSDSFRLDRFRFGFQKSELLKTLTSVQTVF